MPRFSTDYPQKGFVHKVEKGETVSSIAKKYESKIKWIIDANQIVDPTKVYVGKELFLQNNHGEIDFKIGKGLGFDFRRYRFTAGQQRGIGLYFIG